MAVTGAETHAAAGQVPAAGWVRRDPVRAVALALIAAHLVARADIASAGFLVGDDFILAARAAELGLSAEYLLGMFNNHLVPGGLLITWLVTRTAGLEYWPYLLVMLGMQAILSIAFYRLLRLLFSPGWGLLIPLCLFLFSPLTLEATAWWAVGGNQLPMQLAVVLAIGAQVKYARTGRARHLVTLGAAFALGLLFFEKSLLIAPLVFLWTACLLVTGGVVHSVVETVRRYWRSWLVLSVVSLAYLGVYLARATSSVRGPASAGEVVTFVRQMLGSTLIPGFLGGPWRWLDAGDGPPVTAPPEFARWLTWAGFVALVVLTVRARRIATRAWVLLALYIVIIVGLLGATRLGMGYSSVAGLVPRYVNDVVVLAALCIGIALLGLASPTGATAGDQGEPGAATPADAPDRPRLALMSPERATAALVVTLLALVGSASWSAARFGDDWAHKQSREYLRTVRAELAAAPPGTVFFDAPVPDGVVSVLSQPYNMQSRLFQHMHPRPQFVTVAENPRVFDTDGRVRPIRVAYPTVSRPGPDANCGHELIDGRTVRIMLPTRLPHSTYTIRLAYVGYGESPAVLEFGDTPGRFQTQGGLRHMHFVLQGGGDTLELTVLDPKTRMCAGDVAVGIAEPQR